MGKPLVIVESPAKAKTIGKFLGNDYVVEACVGHIRDLPQGADQVPAKYKGLPWSRHGVDVENDFSPLYVLTPRGKDSIKTLKGFLKDAPALYVATDEDREGEAIAWHLLEALKPKVPVHRLVFHEITEKAIRGALAGPRELDMDLVRAQETRRIVDRLFGYDVSPVLWRKIKPRLSAGRVQSVSVRLVVERERARMAFVSAKWWGLTADFALDTGLYSGVLQSVSGKRVANSKDFDPNTGSLKGSSKSKILVEADAIELQDRIRGREAEIITVEDKGFTERPSPPFTTSSLQQEANRKFRWSAKRTMSVAQKLYENGWITYMRTDSTNLSSQAISAARGLIKDSYGDKYLPSSPRRYSTSSAGAQEAHEAIRPAGDRFKTLVQSASLEVDQSKLYELIWKRTVACQMSDATGVRRAVETKIDEAIFRSRGKSYNFVGFRKAYVEGADDPSAALAEREVTLPTMSKGDSPTVETAKAEGHDTKPPNRLTDATLIKQLESKGIGRPSTYASIIDTIEKRGYIFKKGTALVATWTAFAVTRLMEEHFGDLVDYDFTAQLESGLDMIAEGKSDQLGFLKDFYNGENREDGGLMALVDKAIETADPKSVCSIPLGQREAKDVVLRVGRYGPYIQFDETTRSVPEDMPPDELTLSRALELVDEQPEGPRELGTDKETGLSVTVQVGRFGPYVQIGEQEKGSKKKPKRASLLKGMEADSLDFETAIKLLSLPRIVGQSTEGKDILAKNGRYGPYIDCAGETRSLPEDISPLDVTLEKAIQLLSEKPTRGRKSATVLKELGEDSEGRKIQVKSGRWGPYITDGKTNATLKKGVEPETVTMEMASEALEKKRSQPKKAKRKSSAKKKTTKKASAKKSPAKKTAAKKAPAKKKTIVRKAKATTK